MILEVMNAINTASQGVAYYTLVGGQQVDAYPVKTDGFQYTDATYLNCLNNGVGCHNPDAANMNSILSTYNICSMLNANQFDELWIFGAPYMGIPVVSSAGPTSYPSHLYISGTGCNKPLVVTSFGYNPSLYNRYENIASRMNEAIWAGYGIGNLYGQTNFDLWNVAKAFSAYQGSNPGQAGCGFVGTAPNSTVENGPSNIAGTVPSRCVDFANNYPYLTNRYDSVPTTSIGCSSWGCSDAGLATWYLSTVPKYKGRTNGKWDNWWRYFYNYDASVNYNSSTYDPKGLFEGGVGSTCRVMGWTCDPNQYSQTLAVDFYVGTTLVGSTNAGIQRNSSVATACGGYAAHGFDYTIPNLHGGSKSIYARVKDVAVGGGQTGAYVSLPVSPQQVSCP